MLLDKYNEAVDELIKKVRTTQRENVIKAGKLIAETVENGGNVYLSGICHSIEVKAITLMPIFLASKARSTALVVRPETEEIISTSPGRILDSFSA